jgi:hypothetical protein
MNTLKEIPIGNAENLIGKKFHQLTVLYRTENHGKRIMWVCQCDCGNITIVAGAHLKNGHTKSCGCYKKNGTREDLTNKRFGKLVVLKYHHSDDKGHTFWECQCDCGKKHISRKDALTGGKTVSCGCYKNKISSENNTIDLTNQHFEKLTVIKRAGSDTFNNALWLCQCECGNKKIIAGFSLRKGDTKSCGCIKSFGEATISKLLQDNNILFEREKTFEDCYINKGKAKFDFYVNNQYIIEFDGIQHFRSNSGWNTKEKVLTTQQSDKIKNQWCKNNNIPLIRIPYTHKDIILEDLLLETTTFLYKEKEE